MGTETEVEEVTELKFGGEEWKKYYSFILGRHNIWYKYKTPEGKVFSCTARTLEDAREQRDKWRPAHEEGGKGAW